jgi:hypothetical protein
MFLTADPLQICRGTWFKGSTSENHWIPLGEEEAMSIEKSHQTLWRSMVLVCMILVNGAVISACSVHFFDWDLILSVLAFERLYLHLVHM